MHMNILIFFKKMVKIKIVRDINFVILNRVIKYHNGYS